MPGGDGTGPMGMGPMTGRAAGYCAGYPVPGYMNPLGRRFFGFGRGGGRGWRNWFYATGLPGRIRAGYAMPAWGGDAPPYAPPTPEQERDALKAQADQLSRTLEEVKARLDELEKEK